MTGSFGGHHILKSSSFSRISTADAKATGAPRAVSRLSRPGDSIRVKRAMHRLPSLARGRQQKTIEKFEGAVRLNLDVSRTEREVHV